MNSKIGFFYNLPYSDGYLGHSNRILLTYECNHLAFKLFDKALIKKKTLHNLTYYSFDYPVVYTEDSAGRITSIEFLSEFPIRIKSEIENLGNEFSIPFLSPRATNNTGITPATITSTLNTLCLSHPEVLQEGEKLVYIRDEDYYRVKRGEMPTKANFYENLFYRCVITYYALNTIVSDIKNTFFRLGLYNPPISPSNENYYQTSIRLAKKYIDSFSIEDILNDLEIEVTESFRHKTGDNDSYSVYRKATISYPIANHDTYLKRLIGIGETRIYHDSGYCSAESMRIADLVTGIYKGKDLEQEKERIINTYSKADHIGYILSKNFSAIMHSFINLESLERSKARYKQALIESFHLDVVSNKGRKFEKNLYELHHDSAIGAQTCIDEVNKKIHKLSECSISPEDLEILKNNGLKLFRESFFPYRDEF